MKSIKSGNYLVLLLTLIQVLYTETLQAISQENAARDKSQAEYCYYIKNLMCEISSVGICEAKMSTWIKHTSHNGECGYEHQTAACPLSATSKKECRPSKTNVKCGHEANIDVLMNLDPDKFTGWCSCSCVSEEGQAQENSPDNRDVPNGNVSAELCEAFNNEKCNYWPSDYEIGLDPHKDEEVLEGHRGVIKCEYFKHTPEELLPMR